MLTSELERFVREDLGEMDDSSPIVPEINAEATIIAKEECIISGLEEVDQILKYFSLEGERLVLEGASSARARRLWSSEGGRGPFSRLKGFS